MQRLLLAPDAVNQFTRLIIMRRIQINSWEGDPRDDYKNTYPSSPVDLHKDIPEQGHVLIPTAPVIPRRGYYTEKRVAHLPVWGGECLHYDPSKGCNLTREHMPAQCRHLVARTVETGDCDLSTEDKPLLDRVACAVAWIPHQNILSAAINAADGKVLYAKVKHG